jgi:F0F1-type ATP synthase epsilon subunit
MKLHIASPEAHKTLEAAWFEVETPAGNFIIQAGHAPTFLTIKPESYITIRLKSGKQESLQVHSGLVHVTRGLVTIILG